MSVTRGLRGSRLREVRERRNMTQGEFAVKLGITTDPDNKGAKGSISRYENGHMQPMAETLDKMAEALGVSADYLLGRTDDPRGVVTEEGLPDDELELLRAYREKNLGRLVDLGTKKYSEPPSDDPT